MQCVSKVTYLSAKFKCLVLHRYLRIHENTKRYFDEVVGRGDEPPKKGAKYEALDHRLKELVLKYNVNNIRD